MDKRVSKKTAPKPPAKSNVTTYTMRGIPSQEWKQFKEKLDDKGQKVNWAFAEFVRKVGTGEIVLTK